MNSTDNTSDIQQNENNPLPTRFEVELEFVQSLANIPYVTYLFTQQQNNNNNNNKDGYNFNWKSPEFKNYLKYLEYWCQPPYCQGIVYPNALHVLKLINGFFESHATINEDGMLDGVDELPKFLQLQGPHLMNEMVNRWQQ